jgi:uncharacterized protein (DUF2236 family)
MSISPTDDDLPELPVGPGSVTWRYASDARLGLMSVYALLMQVAHPTVGAGVSEFSNFQSEPWARLFRTTDFLMLMTYGGPEAVAVGRRVRDLHKGIKGVKPDGSRYHALEPGAYAWVWATLIDAFVVGHQNFGRPMSPDRVERFYAEYRPLGRLLGVRDRDLPGDWAGFRAYFDETVAQRLEHTQAFDDVLATVDEPLTAEFPRLDRVLPPLHVPVTHAFRLSVGLLPPALLDRCGIEFTAAQRAELQTVAAATRALTPVMPRRLLIAGPDYLRWRRAAIRRGPIGAEPPLRSAA